MQLPLNGTCQCGAVTIRIDGAPLVTYACHCMQCQKRTGSAFSMGMVLPFDGVDINGELSSWERISDQGNTNTRYSCISCGNIIYGTASQAPGLVKLQAGLLNDTSAVAPEVHIWTENAQSWFTIPEGTPCYAQQPEDPMELLGAAQEYRRRMQENSANT